MKKLLTLLLTLLMVFTLVGCNSKQDTPVVQEPEQQEEVIEQTQEETEIVGGYVEVEDGTLTDELIEVFNKALEGLTGASYNPQELLATQVVAGTNYKFLASGTKTTNPVTNGTYYITIYKDLQGNVQLLDIETIEETQDEPKTLDPSKYDYWVVFYDQYNNELQRTVEEYGTVPSFKSNLPVGFIKWVDKKTNKDITDFTAITTNTYFKAVCNPVKKKASKSSSTPIPTPAPTPTPAPVCPDSEYLIKILSGASGSYGYALYEKQDSKYSLRGTYSGEFADTVELGEWYHSNVNTDFDSENTLTECNDILTHTLDSSIALCGVLTNDYEMDTWNYSNNKIEIKDVMDLKALSIYYGEGTDPVVQFMLNSTFVVLNDAGEYTYDNGTYKFRIVMDGEIPKKFVVDKPTNLVGDYERTACLAKGTLITMADGSKKPIEELKEGDDVRAFDHENGVITNAKIMDYWKYDEKMSGLITLHFTNDIDVNIVTAHGFFNKEDNKYVVLNKGNIKDYIGKQFYNADNGSWETLLSATYSNETVDTFFMSTDGHFNCVAEGMLNVEDGIYALIVNIFNYDDELKVDKQKKADDISKYGLFDYKDAKYLTEEGFDAFKIAYIKVAIGKGIITEEQWGEIVKEGLSYESNFVREEYADQATKHPGN